MPEESEPGMCANASNERATEAGLVDNAAETSTTPPEQASQRAKSNPASSSPHKGPVESQGVPPQQDIKDPKLAETSEPGKGPPVRAMNLQKMAEFADSPE